MNSDEIKYIGTSTIFVFCIIFTIIPIYVKGNSWLSRLDALAGGVFLGAAMVHLYPEGMHELEDFSFPLYAYIAIIGFFLMQLIGSFTGKHSHGEESSEDQNEEDSPIEVIQNSAFGTEKNTIQATTKALYGALMFHSFVEAVAFGVVTEKASCLSLFFALIGHKPVEIFALSLAVLKNHPTKLKYFSMMGIFSVVSPITTIAFHFIGKSLGSLFGGIVTALSAGVFIFIGFHEMSELTEHIHDFSLSEKAWHLGFLFIGLLWMSLMGLFGEHDHHHE